MTSEMYANIVISWMRNRGIYFSSFDTPDEFAEKYADESFGVEGFPDGFGEAMLIEIYDYWTGAYV